MNLFLLVGPRVSFIVAIACSLKERRGERKEERREKRTQGERGKKGGRRGRRGERKVGVGGREGADRNYESRRIEERYAVGERK